jgi:catechol 2,3-dioxygenase-like lactoylglutathione lyase family enzyme
MKTGHVGLNVPDVDRALPFYTGVFGWAVLQESAEPRFAFLGDADGIVLTLWEQSDGTFAADRPGLHHLAFQVAAIDEVEAAEERVRELGGDVQHGGIVPHAEGAHSGGIFFTDPDGIRLEIYAGDGAHDHGEAPAGAAPTCGFF